MSFIFPVKGNVFCQGLLLYGGVFFVGAFHSTYNVYLRFAAWRHRRKNARYGRTCTGGQHEVIGFMGQFFPDRSTTLLGVRPSTALRKYYARVTRPTAFALGPKRTARNKFQGHPLCLAILQQVVARGV